MTRVQDYLAPGGFLIILVPAHQFAYSEFDKTIGHYRRYNKKTLRNAVPQSLLIKRIIYLDSMGLLASIANKYSLKQNYPTQKQISFWDKVMVRISKFTDLLINYHTGKTLMTILQKPWTQWKTESFGLLHSFLYWSFSISAMDWIHSILQISAGWWHPCRIGEHITWDFIFFKQNPGISH